MNKNLGFILVGVISASIALCAAGVFSAEVLARVIVGSLAVFIVIVSGILMRQKPTPTPTVTQHYGVPRYFYGTTRKPIPADAVVILDVDTGIVTEHQPDPLKEAGIQ